VAGVISLAERLGLPIVAGVQTEEQLALRRLGCSFGQGYHLGRPAPLAPSYASTRVSLRR
jgi:EAL domain-containing protein (putative c-di-GMP-specific phosphodiesterase class I)